MEKGLLNQKSLAEYLDVSPNYIYLLRKRSDFPKPICFSTDEFSSKKFWVRTTIDRWLENLAREK